MQKLRKEREQTGLPERVPAAAVVAGSPALEEVDVACGLRSLQRGLAPSDAVSAPSIKGRAVREWARRFFLGDGHARRPPDPSREVIASLARRGFLPRVQAG